MDIGSILTDGLLQQGIDQPDNRRIVFLFQQVGGFRQGIRQAGKVQTFQVVSGLRGSPRCCS